jgi:hypothetical protein
VKAGFNRASIETNFESSSDTSSSRFGLIGGAYVRFDITDFFGLQPELLITQKGYSFIERSFDFDDDDFEDLEGTYGLTYLEVPVLARLEFATQGGWRPFLFGGPAFGIKVGNSISIDGQEREVDDDEVTSTDSGLVIGGGIQVGRTAVEARFTTGGNFYKRSFNNDEFEARNRVFSILIGYEFR